MSFSILLVHQEINVLKSANLRIFAPLLFCAVFGVASTPAAAAFLGDYACANWTANPDTGSISCNSTTVVEISSDASGGAHNTDFTIAAATSGIVTFDWLYNTADLDGSSYDPFGYLLNSVFTQLTVDSSFATQSGTATFAVLAGDIFGFRAASTDSEYGSATTQITNFSAPVPEPASLALLGLGLAGLGLSRRKKQKVA